MGETRTWGSNGWWDQSGWVRVPVAYAAGLLVVLLASWAALSSLVWRLLPVLVLNRHYTGYLPLYSPPDYPTIALFVMALVPPFVVGGATTSVLVGRDRLLHGGLLGIVLGGAWTADMIESSALMQNSLDWRAAAASWCLLALAGLLGGWLARRRLVGTRRHRS